jgi:nucleoside-diphosphate-sugar epimerase
MARPTVAVIGASGFIGGRIVEMLHGDGYDVRPIVRRASGLASFAVDGRVADAFDAAAMTDALQGCDVVVHSLAGDRKTIVDTIAPVYQAAEKAGCRRIVYLSSAVVHGQAPAAGTDERSPLSHDQAIDYNVSKVMAEEQLVTLCRSGSVEAVVLRPGIVYGPRSQWIGGLADSILASTAYLIDGGTGLCNAIYVDNVVEAIIRCFEATDVNGEAFLIGEEETPSWHDFYEKVATALGRSVANIPSLSFEQRPPGFMDRLDTLRQSTPVKAVTRSIPRFVRKRIGAAWAAASEPSGPSPTLEMALLHTSRYVPSWEKARTQLGYEPAVPVDEAWRRTIAWMASAGYPVVEAQHG